MLPSANTLAHSDDKHRPLARIVEDLQARGQYTVTAAELTGLAGGSAVAFRAALRRLKSRGRIASPRRGFFVLVPLEYREAGSPPASWFIEALARFLKQPYYVGLLTAAALHGAAHQQPMAFQVMTDRPTRPVRVGRVHIHFHVSRLIKTAPTVRVQTETGSMRVSTPEATAFDLVRFARASGHLSNVATVLGELTEKVDAKALAKLANAYAVPDVQRLGYLLDRLGRGTLAQALHRRLQKARRRPVLLAPGQTKSRKRPHPRWSVVANEVVEVDR